MAINFLRANTTVMADGTITRVGAARGARKTIDSSKDVSGVEVRMLPPLIKNNHTTPVFPFPGFAKLYCLTIVVSDAVNQLVGAIDIKGFPRIGDHEYLPVNKTVFYWQSAKESDKAPTQVHVFSTIIKSKQALRDTGEILSGLKDDTDYKNIVGSLGNLMKDAAKFNVVTDLVVQLASLAGRHLGHVEDKPIGTVINSYTTLHGDFDHTGVVPLLYDTGDADFKFEIIVRRKSARPSKAITGATATRKKAEPQDNVTVDMPSL